MSVPQITMWDHPVSSYAQKVRILLREKGLPFTQIFLTTPGVDLAHFQHISPRGEIPAIEHAGAAVFDSTIIAEYLEDAFPETPAILPSREDPLARARVRMIEDVADTAYEAINWGWGEAAWFGRAGAEDTPLYQHLKSEVARQTSEMYDWLEKQLGNAEFFGGHVFSVADAIVIVVVQRSIYYGFAPTDDSKLHAWYHKTKQRPAVAETFKEFQDNVATMPAAKDIFLSGQRQRQYRDFRLEWMVKSGAIEVVSEGLKNKNVKFNWPDGQRPTSGSFQSV